MDAPLRLRMTAAIGEGSGFHFVGQGLGLVGDGIRGVDQGGT